jgi:hypothetical protein
MFAIHMKANNTPNGNPCRLYLVCDSNGDILQAIDEGFRGISSLHAEHPTANVTMSIYVSNSEYRRILREYGKR